MMNRSKLPLLLRLSAAIIRVFPTNLKEWMYHIPIATPTVRRLLSHVAPPELTGVGIASGPLAGWQMNLHLKTEKYYWLGTYEPAMEMASADFVRPGDIVYDIGANIGYFSLSFARKVGQEGHVFAFEPLPSNIERLRHNVKLNQQDERITIVPCAVSDSAGTEEFLAHSLHSMGKLAGAGGRDTAYQESLKVRTITVDGFIYEDGRPAPDIVKMDIEGGETKAIKGMTRMLTDIRPKLILELHGPEAAMTVWKTLEESNYVLCRLRPGYPRYTSYADMDWREHLVALPN